MERIFYDFLDTSDCELERMNENKMGKPFIFPNSFILAVGYIRYPYHLPYRQTKEGIIKATGKKLTSNPPQYGHNCKRINKLNIDIKREKKDDDYVIVSIVSTGTKVTIGGHWMAEKQNTPNKKGYFKNHVSQVS